MSEKPRRTDLHIESFRLLGKGWHFGEGDAYDESIIQRALVLCHEAVRLGFDKTNAFPGLSGEVVFCVYMLPHYHEFAVETDGTVSYLHEINDDEMEELLGISDERALAILAAL